MTLQETLALVRPHLLNLQPYSSARDEFDQSQVEQGKFVYLDANENPFNTGHNRYPDPHQRELKKRISAIKGVNAGQIFLGNGSDEAIDLVIRLFCGNEDNILIPAPTYGMYKVSAEINNVKIKAAALTEDFALPLSFLSNADERTRVIFLCSPNNPSGNRVDVMPVLKDFQGIVVVDEAYIDFTSGKSLLTELDHFPNLIVLQTFSKAWGLAGLRLGMAFAQPEIISLLNRIKPPYNISSSTQTLALEAIQKREQTTEWVELIIAERQRVAEELSKLSSVKKVFPSDANFLLVRMDRAADVYNKLIADHIVVRDRSQVKRCEDCLRITIGTKNENDHLLNALKIIQ
ncbi:MAG TPA: histidinol-phosphate transaminase [Cyclobacteriaceae bacterium]|nr:histidinol-phosphate transaminase [Cyclobacteriaceae bacterium]